MNRRNQSRPVLGREKRELNKPISTDPISEVRVISGPTPWYQRVFITVEVVLILVALPMLINELNDRHDDRITRAWQLITTSAPGNSGKGPALEYLNSESWIWEPLQGFISNFVALKERISLAGIDLSRDTHGGSVIIHSTDLTNADFNNANLTGADLIGVILKDADLANTKLERADFSIAYLAGANFYRAEATGAEFTGALLNDVSFLDANLTRVNFSDSDLSDVSFRRANVSSADFKGADFNEGVICYGSWHWKGEYPSAGFPCKSYKEVADESDPEKIRVYLLRPESEESQ